MYEALNFFVFVVIMAFNATFNNISVISWQSVLLVEEIRVPGENHRPVADKTLSHNVVSGTPCHERDSNSQRPYDHDHDGPRFEIGTKVKFTKPFKNLMPIHILHILKCCINIVFILQKKWCSSIDG